MVATRVRISVPGSSANIGAGFDCIALACNLHCNLDLKISPAGANGPVVEVSDQLKGALPEDESNLVVRVISATFPEASELLEQTSLKISSDIPLARGLGSSAAAIVGALAAGTILSGETVNRKNLLQLATRFEGHPDNVAASIFGGLVVTARNGRDYAATCLEWPEEWVPLAVVPNYEVATSAARAVLPGKIDRAHAVSNIQSTAMMVAAIQKRDARLLKMSLHDKLHEPYRESLVKEMKDLRSLVASLPAIGTVLSGAGPTMLVIAEQRHTEAVVEELEKWSPVRSGEAELLKLRGDSDGLRVNHD